jgi:hypothetical protein
MGRESAQFEGFRVAALRNALILKWLEFAHSFIGEDGRSFQMEVDELQDSRLTFAGAGRPAGKPRATPHRLQLRQCLTSLTVRIVRWFDEWNV